MYKSNQFPVKQKVESVTSTERVNFVFDNFESKMNRLYEYIMHPEKREILYGNKRGNK